MSLDKFFSDCQMVAKLYQMKNDPHSCERNLCNCVRSLKKIQDFKIEIQRNTNTYPHLAYQTPVQALTSIHHWMFYHSVKTNQYYQRHCIV